MGDRLGIIGLPLPRELPPTSKTTRTPAAFCRKYLKHLENLERAKGLEPSTPTLARSCSTTELHPHPGLAAISRRQRQSYAKCSPRMQQSVRRGTPPGIAISAD